MESGIEVILAPGPVLGENNQMSPRRGHSFTGQILLAILIGTGTGLLFGPKVAFLGNAASYLIQLIKILATPLIFFAIVDAFCKTQIRGKSGLRLLLFSTLNATVAILIALGMAQFIPDGGFFEREFIQAQAEVQEPSVGAAAPSIAIAGAKTALIPKSVLEPFVNNEIIFIVIFAILVGIAIRSLEATKNFKNEIETLEHFFSGMFQIIATCLSWFIRLLPIAIFGAIAKSVGSHGLGVFYSLFLFVGFIVLGFLLHAGVYYIFILKFIARVSPRRFFAQAAEPLLTAFGASSSLATLPVTLHTLQKEMKVSVESSRLAACVGTNLNHDGILLYEALAALIIAKIYGIHLTAGQTITVLGNSVIAAIGIAGVPEAGLITLPLVLGSVGLPTALIPVMLSVDWFLGRLRATVNVTSDMVVAHLLDRYR